MDGLRADASIDPCWFRGGGCRVDDGGGSGVFPLIVIVVAVVDALLLFSCIALVRSAKKDFSFC